MKSAWLKKVGTGCLAVIVATSLLVGCGSSESEESSGKAKGSVEVSFWTLATRQEGVEPIVEAFNQSQDKIKVTVSFYDVDGIKDACKVAAQSDTLPSMWFNWGGSLGGYYVDNACTYDLTAYAKEHKWEEKFTASAQDLCTFDGKLSGYPTSYNVIGVFYNKQIFEQYGLKTPETFEEFEKLCADLKANGVTPMVTGGLYGWHPMRLLEQFVEYYAGKETHDKMNSFEESWNNEAVLKAMTKFKEFSDKKYFPDGWTTQDPNNTYMSMGAGTCAMDVQGQWYDGILSQNDLNPEEFGWFPFPNETKRMSAFAEMTQFNKNLSDEELNACIEFMDYYHSEENVKQYGEYYNLPLPVVGAKMPSDMPNVESMITYSNENGIFTITDQAFPTEVADVLFDAEVGLSNGSIQPNECGVKIQEAIDNYKGKK